MRKLFLPFIFTIILFFNNICTAMPKNPCGYAKEAIKNLTCYGPTTLKDTTITGQAIIAGDLKASNAILNSLQMTGAAEFNSTQILGEAFIAGWLTASHSAFKNKLNVTADKVTLNASTIEGDVVMTAGEKAPILELSCYSHVEGSVKFVGKSGVVYLSKNSIVHGKIVNGKVLKINSAQKCQRSNVAGPQFFLPIKTPILSKNGALVKPFMFV